MRILSPRVLALLMLIAPCTPVSSLTAASSFYENQLIGHLEIISEFGSVEDMQTELCSREGTLFSQHLFDQDLKLLAKNYDRIEPRIETVDGKLYITIHIWAKPRIRLIRVTGNQRIRPSRIEKELSLEIDSPFDYQNFTLAFHKLKTYYIKEGFFEAKIDYRTERDFETNEIDIYIDIDEGRAGLIKNIEFCNFDPEEESEILNLMITKTYNRFIGWLMQDGRYNEEAIQQDRYVILNYLQNRGYVDAQVEISVQDAGEKNRLTLVLSTEKGPRYHFGTLSFSGNHVYGNEEIAELFKIRSGEPFSMEKIHLLTETIGRRYTTCGYIDAFVNFEPQLNRDTCTYDVKFLIEEGEQWRVGLIKLIGTRYTQPKVILHEVLVTPGELFDLNKLRLTELRLRNMGYFENVTIYTVDTEGPCGLEGNWRDVVIEVEETSTGNFGAFMGFSTDQSAFAGLNLTERNFNIAGFCGFSSEGMRGLRGGGEFLHMNATLGSKSQSYSLSWTKPHFLDTPWSVGFDLDRSETSYISDDYSIYATGFSLHATYQCNAFLKAGVHWRLRNTDVHFDKDDEKEDQQELDKSDKKERSLRVKELKASDGLISAMGISLTYDSTNHPLFPTQGFKSRLNAEVAGFGGDQSFFAISYLNNYYFPVFGGVMKFRADIRFLDPIGSTGPNQISLDERFFLGGENEVRGYRPYRLGPKFGNNPDDPKGGISLQVYTVEFSYPLFPRVDLFIFEDAGFLTFNRFDTGLSGLSVGFGGRFQVFAGAPPLTLGMGYPMKLRDSSDRKNFFISFGNRF